MPEDKEPTEKMVSMMEKEYKEVKRKSDTPGAPDEPVKVTSKPAKVHTVLTGPGLAVTGSKMVYESYERNSRSVGLTQIRLVELGYLSAGGDNRGWMSAGTKAALESFMEDKKLLGSCTDENTLSTLFAGTEVVVYP
jgi:hypothetical protein